MKTYIGTKVINAKPMTRLAYHQLRGWTLPADENGDDKGYLVEYSDGGRPNVAGFAGYVSWSPKEQFEQAYRETSGLPFGLAIEALKKGKRVTREGWNGKGQFLYLIKAMDLSSGLKYGFGEYQGEPAFTSAIAIKTTANQIQVGWLASQSDMLAEDWMVLE